MSRDVIEAKIARGEHGEESAPWAMGEPHGSAIGDATAGAIARLLPISLALRTRAGR